MEGEMFAPSCYGAFKMTFGVVAGSAQHGGPCEVRKAIPVRNGHVR